MLSWSKGLNYPSAKDKSKQRTAIMIFLSKLPVCLSVCDKTSMNSLSFLL